MAIGAIFHYVRFPELVVVIVLMTIGAQCIFYWSRQIGFVARRTGHVLVFVFKFEIRFGMIKICDSLDHMKRNFGMTLFAGLPEFILMGILMAVSAIGKPDTGEFLEFHPVLHRHGMTFQTLHGLVYTCQRKAGGGMVKFHYRFESIRIMTV